MAAAKKIAGLPVLPPGYSVKDVGGTSYAVKKRRTRRKFKLTKAQRKKISTAAKKFKFPVLTGLALAPTFLATLEEAQKAPGLGDPTIRRRTLNAAFSSFFPVTFNSEWKPSWQPGNTMRGLLPLGMLFLIKQIGIFTGQRRNVSKLTGGIASLS